MLDALQHPMFQALRVNSSSSFGEETAEGVARYMHFYRPMQDYALPIL
jgi:hypothetical protein